MQPDFFRPVILDEATLDQFVYEHDLTNTDPMLSDFLVQTYRSGQLGQIHRLLLDRGITDTPMETLEWLHQRSEYILCEFYAEIDNPDIRLLHFDRKKSRYNSRGWRELEEAAQDRLPKRYRPKSQTYGTMCHGAMDVLTGKMIGHAPYEQLDLFDGHKNASLQLPFLEGLSRLGRYIPRHEQVFQKPGRCERGFLRELRGLYRDALRTAMKPNEPWWVTWQNMSPYLEHGAGMMFPILGPRRISMLFPDDALDQWLAFGTLLTLVNVLLATQRDRSRAPIIFTEVPIRFKNRDGVWVDAGEMDGICIRTINSKEPTPRMREILWRIKRSFMPGRRPKGFCWDMLLRTIENACGGKVAAVDILDWKFGNGDGKSARAHYTFDLRDVKTRANHRDIEQILRYSACVLCSGDQDGVMIARLVPQEAVLQYWAHDGNAFHDVVESPEKLTERYLKFEDDSRRQARWYAQNSLYGKLMVEEVLVAGKPGGLSKRGARPLNQGTLFERFFDASLFLT